MVATVEQIKRELKAIEQATGRVAQEFGTIYASYLTTLGRAVRQQLILASYHLCTQRYPEQFLQLSFSQRQRLQHALQRLSRQAQQQLAEQSLERASARSLPQSEPPELSQTTDELVPPVGLLESLDNAPESVLDLEDLPSVVEEPAPSDAESEQAAQTPAEFLDLIAAIAPQEGISPPNFAALLDQLEQHLVDVLQGVSQAANQVLQQANVLPQSLPEPIFAAAMKAGEAVDAISPGPPNLLSLLIEVPDAEADEDLEDEDQEATSITPLVAVHLRLAEIEFVDSTLSAWRNKLRELTAQLDSLERKYLKKQQELAIAEAEAAWRASWYEEKD